MYLKNIMRIDRIKDEFGWAAPSEQREYYLLIKVCCQDVLLLFSYS
jgi:hypothetical protein